MGGLEKSKRMLERLSRQIRASWRFRLHKFNPTWGNRSNTLKSTELRLTPINSFRSVENTPLSVENLLISCGKIPAVCGKPGEIIF